MPYNISLVVKGDITVAVWFGMYNMGQRLNTQPALAYCFHTSFVDSGIERVSVPQLDVADAALFAEGTVRTFFMDLQFTDWEEAVAESDDVEETDHSCDVQHWHSKWRETMGKLYGMDQQPQVSWAGIADCCLVPRCMPCFWMKASLFAGLVTHSRGCARQRLSVDCCRGSIP